MTLIKYNQPGRDIFGKRFSDIMDEFFNDAVATRQTSFAPVLIFPKQINNTLLMLNFRELKKKISTSILRITH